MGLDRALRQQQIGYEEFIGEAIPADKCLRNRAHARRDERKQAQIVRDVRPARERRLHERRHRGWST